MPSLDSRITSWMRDHHATISTEALVAAGISTPQRDRLVAAGVIERVIDGAYRFVGARNGELARCAALCTSRPHLVVGGPTAGRIWCIRRSPRDGLVHVIAPPASQPCRQPWVRAYRTALIRDDEIVIRPDGIRLTSPPRTLIDLTRYLRNDALASAIESALHTGLCTVATLYRLAERLNTPGRPWVRRFLRVLSARVPGRPRESDWERRVCDGLVRRGVSGLQPQVKDTLPGVGPVRFDLAIPSIRWVLEVDVHPEHRTLEGQANDHRRDRRSRRHGWIVDRVGELELGADFDGTLDDIVCSIDERRAEVAALAAAGFSQCDERSAR
jgi:very-short-patch-repair endonuclease